jgi:pimeloyl-ACP methyl ester carboxylesterase
LAAIGLASSAFIRGAYPQAPPRRNATPIHEQMFVKIGGIEQWITINGDDRDNPVILFLHGGPGDALSPFAAAMFRGWTKDFTLVQWDQRGAGRTFGATGPSVGPSMTLQHMAQDGIDHRLGILRRNGAYTTSGSKPIRLSW